MRRAVLLVLMALAAPAGAQPLLPLLPLTPPPPSPQQQSPLAPQLPTSRVHRPEPKLLRPIPYVYRQIDHERINQGAVGRTNSANGGVRSLRTGWEAPPLGGNAM